MSQQAVKKNSSAILAPRQVVALARVEWKWWLPAAIISFFLASILMSGWPDGLAPNLTFPFEVSGDGPYYVWLTQRVMEGWIFENPRSGYPFGSSFYDFPASDLGCLLIVKLLGFLFGSSVAAVNLYYLSSFPLIIISAYLSLRAIGVSIGYAICAAFLFAFTPFHFFRLSHLFFASYFVVPIFFYLGFYVVFGQKRARRTLREKGIGLLAAAIIGVTLASFGVYFAIFGLIVLGVAAVAVWMKDGKFASTTLALTIGCFVVFGVFLNIAPNLYYRAIHGINNEVAVRSEIESEAYAFKMMQLISPHVFHRIEMLADSTVQYNAATGSRNESQLSSLGVVGTVGFFLLGVILVAKLAGVNIDARLDFLALLVLVLFLFGTVGGLGSLFSHTLTPMIRAWNRISLFIAFGSLAGLFLALQIWKERLLPGYRTGVSIAVAFLLGLGGLYDQTIPFDREKVQRSAAYHLGEKEFVRKIEESLPQGGAVYQLPYMAFPETPSRVRLDAYDHMAGILYSKTLRWSYAGSKGRPGDLFFRQLADEPMAKQMEVIRRMGFSGLYIDLRGYEEGGKFVIDEVSKIVGREPDIVRSDAEAVFFHLKPEEGKELSGLSVPEIMSHSGYIVERISQKYRTLGEGINFAYGEFPDFVRRISGLASVAEPWGRWTDANMGSSVKIAFVKPLPKKFTMVLAFQPFKPSEGQELVIKIGDEIFTKTMPPGQSEWRIKCNLKKQSVDVIEIIPPNPVSPSELGLGNDPRRLSVGLIGLRFIVKTEE